jgi:predicted O-methyltransferase YrrM
MESFRSNGRGRNCGVSGEHTRFRRAVARSRLAPVAAFPSRFARIARHDAKVLRASARWLFGSREHHNFTYDLTPLSREHMAWFVSVVCDTPVGQVRRYFTELERDDALREHIERSTAASARRGLADRQVRYARRIGWYAMVRARRPAHVVETGVDKGLGTVVLAAALLRNAAEGEPGLLTSIDINPEAGYLAQAAPWREVVTLVVADSLDALAGLDKPVDLFLHDSDHTIKHERREFQAIEPKLAAGAMLITDNAMKTDVLPKYAEKTGRRYLAYRETPADHWFPGDGIGVAW